MPVLHRLAVLLIVLAPWTSVPAELAARVDQLSDAVKRYEADRETWQKTPDVLRALGVRAGAVVADVGAGGGFFASRLSAAVGPGGTVYAVDINPTSVRNLQERFRLGGSGNVNVVHGTITDPGLPPGALDGVLIADAYHEMVEHQAMLQAVRLALKPNGRLVILEKTAPEDSRKAREVQVKIHRIESSIVAKELADAGFAVIERVEQFAANPEAYGGGVWWRMVAVPTAKDMVEQPNNQMQPTRERHLSRAADLKRWADKTYFEDFRSRSYSSWPPIQNQSTRSPSSRPTAR